MSPYLLVLFFFTFLFDQSLSQPATTGIIQQQPISPIQPPASTTIGQPPIQQQPATIAPIQQQPPTGGAAGIVVSPPTQPLPTTTDLPPLPPLTTPPVSAPAPTIQEAGFCKIQIKQKDGKLVWLTINGTIVDQKCGDQQTSSDELAPVRLGGTAAAAPGFGLGTAPESLDSSSGQVSQVGPQQLASNNHLPVTSSVGAKNAVESGAAEEKMATVGVVFTTAVFVTVMAGFGSLL